MEGSSQAAAAASSSASAISLATNSLLPTGNTVPGLGTSRHATPSSAGRAQWSGSTQLSTPPFLP